MKAALMSAYHQPLELVERPEPEPQRPRDVVVRVHAAAFTPGELTWPATWTDRAGRDRTPSVPGHELSGVVTERGYGTTGLTVGQTYAVSFAFDSRAPFKIIANSSPPYLAGKSVPRD